MRNQTLTQEANGDEALEMTGYRSDSEVMPIRRDRPVERVKGVKNVALLRDELGHVLRTNRLSQHRTLREVSAAARVSLGYLSEVERGQKEASSELLASICEALELPLWATLREVSERLAAQESAWVPDTPEELFEDEFEDELAGVA
jgi:transcriptional regulator with XRE-family HTH domain